MSDSFVMGDLILLSDILMSEHTVDDGKGYQPVYLRVIRPFNKANIIRRYISQVGVELAEKQVGENDFTGFLAWLKEIGHIKVENDMPRIEEWQVNADFMRELFARRKDND